jgi:hypothetical protein
MRAAELRHRIVAEFAEDAGVQLRRTLRSDVGYRAAAASPTWSTNSSRKRRRSDLADRE